MFYNEFHQYDFSQKCCGVCTQNENTALHFAAVAGLQRCVEVSFFSLLILAFK